jgi:hypothetical protein
MKTKLLGLIACMALISVSQASAATLVGTTSDATGIDGLVVDSVTYDVTFTNDSYSNVYSSVQPTFFGNQVGADHAAQALVSALNALGVTNLVGLTVTPEAVAVPFAAPPSTTTAWTYLAECGFGGCPISPTWFESSGNAAINAGAVFSDTDYSTFVLSATSATPLPAALPLFATGLGALGLIGWRRKRKASALAA